MKKGTSEKKWKDMNCEDVEKQLRLAVQAKSGVTLQLMAYG